MTGVQTCALPILGVSPPLPFWLRAFALLVVSTLAACPGAAAPGYYCVGSVETQCPVGSHCTGGAAGRVSCMTPANCAAVGLGAEPTFVWSVTTLAGSGSSTPFANGQGTAATFNGPKGIAADASGVVYVADYDNHRIRAVTPSGLVSTLAGSWTAMWADGDGAAASFYFPTGVATYPGSGIIYVADTLNRRIRMLTPSGVATTFAGDGWFSGHPSYVGRWADGQGTSASFSLPGCLTVDSAGVVYVGDANRIRKITPLGAVTTLAGTGSSSPFANGVGTSTATFANPSGVAVDGSGNVYVVDTHNSRIRLILPNGTVSTFAGSGICAWADGTGIAAAFCGPRQLSLAATNGNLLVTDTNNLLIRMITPLGLVTTIAGGTASASAFFPFDGYGTATRFNEPYGITVNSAGTVYVSDGHRIRALTCVPCSPSYYCPAGVPLLCPIGSFCTGSFTAALCPSGTYNSLPGMSSSNACIPCPVNTFQPSPGQSSCTPCPSGTSSTPGSLVCCAAGQASLAGSALCGSATLDSSCTSNASCPSLACRGGYCCNAAAARMGCQSCQPGTGSCATYSPGEACSSAFDCASNLCLGGCCCAASALTTAGCTGCRCWANASTTPATAGMCTSPTFSPALPTYATLSCNASTSLNTSVALSRVITFPQALNVTDAVPLMFLPAASPLNTFGFDIVLATLKACAAFAATPNSPQCSLSGLVYSLGSPPQPYFFLGGADALGMAAAPGCGS